MHQEWMWFKAQRKLISKNTKQNGISHPQKQFCFVFRICLVFFDVRLRWAISVVHSYCIAIIVGIAIWNLQLKARECSLVSSYCNGFVSIWCSLSFSPGIGHIWVIPFFDVTFANINVKSSSCLLEMLIYQYKVTNYLVYWLWSFLPTVSLICILVRAPYNMYKEVKISFKVCCNC